MACASGAKLAKLGAARTTTVIASASALSVSESFGGGGPTHREAQDQQQ
jgi:hypothetical protein